MGLLDELLAGAMKGAMEQGGAPQRGRTPAAGGGDMSRIMMALLPVVLTMLAGRRGAPAGGEGAGGLGDVIGSMLGGAPRGGGAGGLGDILGQVLGGAGGPAAGGGAGGLGDLLQQLERAGYRDQARSWVGTGQNMPISPDVIGQIFGRDGLSQIAARTGLSEDEASAGLSELLPEVVDRVTPGGQVPEFDQLNASVDDLARHLGMRF